MEEGQGESRAATMPYDARADRQDAVSSQAKEKAKSVKEEPTPDKAEELLIMAEDLESVHLDK